jgi:hypothetical protein
METELSMNPTPLPSLLNFLQRHVTQQCGRLPNNQELQGPFTVGLLKEDMKVYLKKHFKGLPEAYLDS